MSRVGAALAGAPPDELADLAGEVTVIGRVAEAPVAHGFRATFPVDVLAVESPAAREMSRDGRGVPRILVRGVGGDAECGDLVRVRGRLAEPRSRAGYPEAELLARRGIHRVLDSATVRVREKGAPSGPGALYQLRRTLEASLRSALPEPHASLTAGIVLGTRAGTPPELRTALAATGTSHIVAVSGFNVTVLAAMLGYVAIRIVGRPWALIPMFLVVWGYTLLVGAPPSAVRAAVMVSLVFVAQAVGRLPDPVTVLAVTGALMLAWDPTLLLDLGFQLSFAATAGLILFAGPIADRLPVLPRLVREPLAVALAAEVATLPLALGTFHTLSLVAPLANLLLGPSASAIMLSGALLAALGSLPGLGQLLAWTTWGLVSYVLAVINWAAELPGAVLFTGRLPLAVVVAWYGLLALWAAVGSADLRALLGHRLPLRAGLVAGTVALLPASAVAALPQAGVLSVSLLDAGGPATFVRAPSGRSVVLDGGATPTPLVASVAQRLSLWERRLDLAVPTRGANGQLAALSETLRRYPARVVLSALAEDGDAGAREDAAADRAGPLTAEPGLIVDLGGDARLEIVDVRVQQDRPTIDAQLVAGRFAVWLPGVGPPSPRWKEAAQAGREAILRLPSRSAAWLREAPSVRWLAIVADGPVALPAGLAGTVPVLDLRIHGDVEIVLDGPTPSLRTARCPAGKGCLVPL